MNEQRATIRYEQLGAHVHVALFLNGGKCGDLVMRAGEEFDTWRRAMQSVYGRRLSEETSQ